MNTSEEILSFLAKHESVTGAQLAGHLKISPQAVHKHLKVLIQEGRVVKEGITRSARYGLPAKRTSPLLKQLKKVYALEGLEEDAVFRDVAAQCRLSQELSKQAFEIFRYAFTELLNNAIDHSRSRECSIQVRIDHYQASFLIRDFGIGIFNSINAKYDLGSEENAVGELIKGKTTTMEERHSGEGIFFSSKSADTLAIRSHRINMLFHNLEKDIFVEQRKFIEGTEVHFTVSRHSRRDLPNIFAEYSPEQYDYGFEKTRVLVKLFRKDYTSRSEARRILSGLDKFREIIFDFTGVRLIGQGFADELFRVFPLQYPGITVRAENATSLIDQMIRHVVGNKN